MAGRPRTTKPALHPNRIAAAREAAGLTQEQLAGQVGMDYRTLGKLERGDSRLRWEVAQRIARALECTPFELVPEGEGLNAQQIELLRLLDRMGPADAERWLKLGRALLPADEERQAEAARDAA